jgi:DNA modification methylase
MNYKNSDCVSFLKTLGDKSIDSIIIDPPYYRVVNDGWDNQWFTVEDYYDWCRSWIVELSRVAKDSCSFWIFGFPMQLTDIIPDIKNAGFTFRQQIVVHKGLQAVAGRTSNKLKMFPTATESIFYYHKESRDLIRDLLQSEKERLNLNGKDINRILGKAESGGGTFSCIASNKKPLEHRVYPTREDWEKLSSVMNLPNYDDVVYKFNIQPGLTDVWSDINFYDRKEGKKFHSTQKPIPLMERLVRSCTDEGDTVLDIFGGSGSTGVACKKLNRNFVGCELNPKYYEMSKERIENTVTDTNCGLYQLLSN